MSIIVNKLTKIYGEQKAIDQISFTADPNQVVGLIGPNGAGKTTTMKILTCYMPPSSGNVQLCGYDISKDDFEIRKIIGYLPEHNPLYGSMYVKEYLSFVCRIHKIQKPQARVNEILDRVGISVEKHKKISELSKGYKQRLGIAQAIIHDPKVLILDEPISGLDPNQLIEIRNLIKELKENKTIIFSSHILQEVESICDRVVILDKGQVITNESISNLNMINQDITNIHLELIDYIDISYLMNIPGIISVEDLGHKKYSVSAEKNKDVRVLIFDKVVEVGNKILIMNIQQDSLENIFKSITKTNS